MRHLNGDLLARVKKDIRVNSKASTREACDESGSARLRIKIEATFQPHINARLAPRAMLAHELVNLFAEVRQSRHGLRFARASLNEQITDWVNQPVIIKSPGPLPQAGGSECKREEPVTATTQFPVRLNVLVQPFGAFRIGPPSGWPSLQAAF